MSLDINKFNSIRDGILSAIERHELESIAATLRLLSTLRDEVEITIRENWASEFDITRLRLVQAELERHIARFENELGIRLMRDLREAHTLGVRLVEQPLISSGVISSTFGLSRELVTVAASFSADLIKGLTSDVRMKITGILQRAVLGSVSFNDAMEQVGLSLESEGAFRSIASRAETIVRTEVLRIQSMATQMAMEASREAISRAGYIAQKQWLATLDLRVRPSHAAAMNQVRDIDLPFKVGGELLMFPRDPDGSAENTINCRCSSAPALVRAA